MKKKPAEGKDKYKFVGVKMPVELHTRLWQEFQTEKTRQQYVIYSWADFIRDRLAATLATTNGK